MIGLGTLVNCGAVLIGATVGLFLKDGLPRRFEQTITSAVGLCTVFIGIGGVLSGMLVVENGQLSTQYTMLLVLSLMLGAVIGEAIDIEKRLDSLGEWCKSRLHIGGRAGATFVDGFVTASLLFCVGAMAIVGSLEDGLSGNYSILFAKSVLDGISAMVFAASLGIGVHFSIIPILFYQGGITLLARFIRPYLSDMLIGQMSCIGSVLIFAIGLNFLIAKRIKVGNLLPAMFLPILFFWLKALFPAIPI